jgi:hypothetical protein
VDVRSWSGALAQSMVTRLAASAWRSRQPRANGHIGTMVMLSCAARSIVAVTSLPPMPSPSSSGGNLGVDEDEHRRAFRPFPCGLRWPCMWAPKGRVSDAEGRRGALQVYGSLTCSEALLLLPVNGQLNRS